VLLSPVTNKDVHLMV